MFGKISEDCSQATLPCEVPPASYDNPIPEYFWKAGRQAQQRVPLAGVLECLCWNLDTVSPGHRICYVSFLRFPFLEGL